MYIVRDRVGGFSVEPSTLPDLANSMLEAVAREFTGSLVMMRPQCAGMAPFAAWLCTG